MTFEINTKEGPAILSPYGPVLLSDMCICDLETGEMRWKPRSRELFASDRICNSWNSKYAGKPFGRINSQGYREGSIFCRQVQGHRVVFAIATGAWPVGQIDHGNRITSDNRPCNLSDVSQSINQRNRSKKANNTSGVTGVYWVERDKRWVAKINREPRERITLGYFTSFDAAVLARRAAEMTLGYKVGHGV
jgi:hypothetical protein